MNRQRRLSRCDPGVFADGTELTAATALTFSGWAHGNQKRACCRFSPVSEGDIKTCFDELRWGARSWSP